MTVIYSRSMPKESKSQATEKVEPKLSLYTFPTVGNGFSCMAASQKDADKMAAEAQANFK